MLENQHFHLSIQFAAVTTSIISIMYLQANYQLKYLGMAKCLQCFPGNVSILPIGSKSLVSFSHSKISASVLRLYVPNSMDLGPVFFVQSY